MNIHLILALLAPLLADVVTTRQGKKIEGRILDYPQHVEVLPADGKKVSIPKSDIEHIDISPNLIESPEIVPFPFDLTERGTHDYISFERTLVCIHQPPGRKIVAIDIYPKVQKLWDLDLPDRVGETVCYGRTLYFMQREEFLDDTRKIKINGAPFSWKVHRLTVNAVDLVTGQTAWKLVVDNKDCKKLLWEFTKTPPDLVLAPDRAILRTLKTGWPMDSRGNVDKSDTRTFMTVTTFDTRANRIADSVDTAEASDLRSRIFVLEDQLIILSLTGGLRFKLLSIGLRDGKVKWRSEEVTGRFFDLVGDQAYVTDPTHLYAYSMKTGKKLDKWAIQHSDGAIEAVDHNYVYYYRRHQEPRALIGYEVKKAEKAFEIPIPEGDDFRHEMLLGHRLFYSDRLRTLRAFHTLDKKPMWEWKSGGTGGYVNLSLQGSGLSFLKDGKLHYVDLNTGTGVWAIRGNFRGIVPVGDAGAVVHKLPIGMELLRRRAVPPEGARFFNASGTPLRFTVGEDAWSIPAFAGDTIYSMTNSGTCYAVDARKGEVAWSVKAASGGSTPMVAPVFSKGRLAVFGGGTTQVYDAAKKTKLFQVHDIAVRADRPSLCGAGLLSITGGVLALTDPETGDRIWDSKVRRPKDFILAGNKAYVLTAEDIQRVDLGPGESEDAAAVPPAATLMAVDGKRLYAATGPLAVGEARMGIEFREIYRSSQQDPKIAFQFKGALAAAGGKVIFSHAGGEVACFDPDASDDAKKTVWSFQAPEFTSPLLVHGGRVWFAAPGKGLLGLNAANGAVEWKCDVSDASLFTPFLAEGKPAFWSSEGWMVQPP